jgi:hypothetical protein
VEKRNVGGRREFFIFAHVASLLVKNFSYIKGFDSKREDIENCLVFCVLMLEYYLVRNRRFGHRDMSFLIYGFFDVTARPCNRLGPPDLKRTTEIIYNSFKIVLI